MASEPLRISITASRPGSPVPGKGRNSTESIQLNTVAFTAIPSASVAAATRVTPGVFANILAPNRMSCQRGRIAIPTAIFFPALSCCIGSP